MGTSRPLVLSLLFAALTAPASAQVRKIVSPAGYANTEAPVSSPLPWMMASPNHFGRWQAIHSDIGGQVRLITAIAFRRDGAAAPQNGTRQIDLELVAGDAVPFDTPSWLFHKNWVGIPTAVLPRQVVNVGPFAATGSPPPFELVFPFTTPILYTGAHSFAYEARIHANTASGLTAHCDAVTTQGLMGFPALPNGDGCTASGRFAPMRLTISAFQAGPTYCFGSVIQEAPANAPVALALGRTNPRLSVPGLCSLLRTDLTLLLDLGVTDANGVLGEGLSTPWGTIYTPTGSAIYTLQNIAPGAQLYVQAHALDLGNTNGLPIANSNGSDLYLPPLGPQAPARLTTLFTMNQSTSYPSALFMTSNLGYGLVTEFTWQ